MKGYTLRAGSKYTLMTVTPSKTHVSSMVADHAILFDDTELVEIDTVTRKFNFRIGNVFYFTNIDDVIVQK